MKAQRFLMHMGKHSIIILIIFLFAFISVKAPIAAKFIIGYICGYIMSDLTKYLDTKINRQ